MQSAFAEARGEEPPASVDPAPAPEAAAGPEAEQEAQQADPVEQKQEETLLAGLNEEQIKNLFNKVGTVDELNGRIEKVFSKLGEFNRTIGELKQHAQSSSGVKLSADKLKRLSSEFPEMAQMIAEDLSEALQGAGGSQAPAFDPSQVDQLVSDRLSAVEKKINEEMEKRWLKRQHRDWESVVQSDDFNLWKDNVLPKDEADQLNGSWDADYISEKLTDFKSWRDKAKQSKETKQKRLEAAIAPKGEAAGHGSAMDEEAAMAAAFKAVRG